MTESRGTLLCLVAIGLASCDSNGQEGPQRASRTDRAGGRSSHHIVALLGAEPPHRHDTHDLLVVVLEGEGEMVIGDATRPIGQHSIVYVPRHTAHSMHNTEQTPFMGYAVFTPPFDGIWQTGALRLPGTIGVAP